MYMTEWPTQSYSLIEQQLSTPAVCLLALAGAPDLEEVVLLLGGRCSDSTKLCYPTI